MDLSDMLVAFGIIVSIVGTIVSIVGTIAVLLLYIWRVKRPEYKELIADPASRKDLLKEFDGQGTLGEQIYGKISNLNKRLDVYFGAKLLGGHGFLRCLSWALLYPILLFLVSAVVGAQGLIIDMPIVQEGVPLSRRLIVVGAVVVVAIIWLEKPPVDWAKSSRRRRLAVAAAAAAAAVAVAGASGGVAAVAAAGAAVAAPILFLIFVLLPLVNGVVDWLSWGVTRWLLRHFKVHQLLLGIFWVLLDVLWVALCIALLTFLLPFAIELFNLVPNISIDWRVEITRAQANPFSDGILLFGMLLTTMIPTAIHLVVTIFAFLSVRSHFKRKACEAIEQYAKENNKYHFQSAVKCVGRARGWLPSVQSVAALSLVLVILSVLLYVFFHQFLSLLLDIANLGASTALWIAG